MGLLVFQTFKVLDILVSQRPLYFCINIIKSMEFQNAVSVTMARTVCINVIHVAVDLGVRVQPQMESVTMRVLMAGLEVTAEFVSCVT